MHLPVEVWRIDLASAPSPSAADLEILSADELARHRRYLVAEPARVFATTRVALRRLLGRRLGLPPESLEIETGPAGKPALTDRRPPFFNVSHCATCALIAFSDRAQVGVDVESRAALAADMHVAALACTATELAWFQVSRERVDTTLTRLWSRKEAVLKAAGVGLARPMRELDLGAPDAVAGHCETVDLGRVAWRDLLLSNAEVGAVAVLGAEVTGIGAAVRPYVSP